MHPEAYDFIPLTVEEVCFVGTARIRSRRSAAWRLPTSPGIVDHLWQAHLPMRSLLEQIFEEAGLPFPLYATETTSTFATLALLRSGDGTIGTDSARGGALLRRLRADRHPAHHDRAHRRAYTSPRARRRYAHAARQTLHRHLQKAHGGGRRVATRGWRKPPSHQYRGLLR